MRSQKRTEYARTTKRNVSIFWRFAKPRPAWDVSLIDDEGVPILRNANSLARGVALSTAKALKHKGPDAPLLEESPGDPGYCFICPNSALSYLVSISRTKVAAVTRGKAFASTLVSITHSFNYSDCRSPTSTSRKLLRPASRLSMISSARSSGSGRLSRSVRLLSLSQKMSRLVLSRALISS